jgi:hypothetical protein
MNTDDAQKLVETLVNKFETLLSELKGREVEPEELLHQLVEIASKKPLIDVTRLPLSPADLHCYEAVAQALQAVRQVSKKPETVLHTLICTAAQRFPPVWQFRRFSPRLELILDGKRDGT